MFTRDEARKLAQAVIAYRAAQDSQYTFARECMDGAWDETNRNDIKAVMEIVLEFEEHA
jgi:hypothetical protein